MFSAGNRDLLGFKGTDPYPLIGRTSEEVDV
jgi:hypothetical protein